MNKEEFFKLHGIDQSIFDDVTTQEQNDKVRKFISDNPNISETKIQEFVAKTCDGRHLVHMDNISYNA